MAGWKEQIYEARIEDQSNGRAQITEYWKIGQHDTLSAVSLEEGDALPDDANAEIVDSRMVEDKAQLERLRVQSGQRVVRVVGEKSRGYDGALISRA